MRAIIFHIYLCFFLLAGGNIAYGKVPHNTTTHSAAQNLPVKQQIKLRNTSPSPTLMESTDIDLEEEFHNEKKTNKVLAGNQSLFNNWYPTLSSQSISKEYSQRIKIFAPFCGYSNPIYIRQQVLRI